MNVTTPLRLREDDREAKQNRMRSWLEYEVKSQGVWEGVYRHIDPEGQIIDQHRSRLITHFPEAGPYPFHQVNIYTWDDGRTVTLDFWVDYDLETDSMVYDDDKIKGYFRKITEDHAGVSLLGHWRRHALPGVYFYEMIQRNEACNRRTRTWQWIKDEGGVYRRTLVDEEKISDDWRGALKEAGLAAVPSA